MYPKLSLQLFGIHFGIKMLKKVWSTIFRIGTYNASITTANERKKNEALINHHR